jgi:hypothetical protein
MIQAGSANLRPISLERFESAVASTGAQRRGEAVPVKNDPPQIEISTVPSMPVLIDGEPIYREVPHTSLMRVMNTRPLLLRDASGTYYLKVFDGWMQAPSLTGKWTVAASVPSACDIALKAAIEQKAVDLLVGGDPKDPRSAPSLKTQAPRIFVTTKPTELLVFEGQPKFLPIGGTKLMYASNTTGRVFVDADNQKAYVLVAGRWCAGPSTLTGPWAFVPGDKLPDDFRKIPDDSPVENVKASIPGTEQAEEAIVANSIPQTAMVKRSTATFTPAFDSEPRLEPIEGTQLRWVVNASLPIVAVGTPTEYFGVQNAVWFVSSSLDGPWLVATSVPAAVYSIPVSSPLHYITYVRVYDYTPDYVIVGYTPGYSGVYVSDGCIVYGTGFYYQPWIGTVWYGQPVTYGFGAAIAYAPWAGWYAGFGFGWTWGAATAALGWALGTVSLVGRLWLGRVLPVDLCGRRHRVGSPRRRRRMGSGLFCRHHGQHLSALGRDHRRHAYGRRLQRMDWQSVGWAGRPRLQLSHGCGGSG